ncbi:hypothetical protein [Turneriella parva]|uniref:Uncharacterized protein n=1 Tax=Turneriella parva (strain ATCC BAA-1111 / DSM 21527 / NCTC 11395 / H) TaxID=869212 RepID=I4B8Z2_TURPD|nr:hypothetical protein [Turneriella parva]AFM13749.1 hypothetical protein Turpa_3110 [Turneriella parva DSM 21527]
MEDLYTLTPSRSEQAQEMNRLVRLLAQSGKNNFKKFVYDPLYKAAWERRAADARKTLEHLRAELKNPAYRNTLAPNCKRMIGAAMAENLSVFGDTVLFFLEVIQIIPQVGEAKESAEFMSILKGPLGVWQKEQDERSAYLFDRELNNMQDAQIAEALEPVKLGVTEERARINAEIQRLYQQILIASRADNYKRAGQLLSRYMIEYSDAEDYAEKDVRKVIDALKARDKTFEESLNALLATDLYYRISQGIMKGDLRAAVRMIRKYAHIFEGNPNIRYYYEIDRLERMLYNVITKKDLWKFIKKA